MHWADRLAGYLLWLMIASAVVFVVVFTVVYVSGGGLDELPRWTFPPILQPAQEI